MRGTPLVLAVLAAAAIAAPAAATRLEYRGTVLTPRAVEALARAALRAPASAAARGAFERAVAVRLEALGHLDARVAAAHDSAADVLTLDVREGVRATWGELTLRVPREDSLAFAAALDLRPGAPAAPAALGAALERAVEARIDAGHPYARLAITAFEPRDGIVAVTLAGESGPRVVVAGARIDGLRATREGLALRALGPVAGRPFRPRAAEQGRLKLEQLGLFRSVRFDGIEAAGVETLATLRYVVEEPRYNRFEGAVGVQGDAGVAGLARLELGNLGGTGRAALLRWESRGRGLADFGARLAEPMVLGLPLRLEGSIEQQLQDTLYTRTRWGTRARWALSASEAIELGWDHDRVVQEEGPVEQARLHSTRFGVERTALDALVAPRRGTRVRLAASQTFKRETLRPPGERRSRSSTAELDGEWHRPFGPARGLALELRAAGRFGGGVLADYERWPLGGAATLRGHDEEAFRVDRFALSRLEARWFLGGGGTRAFLFWDHAWTYERIASESGVDDVTDHADGLGFGLRLETAAGLIGVDYGLEPGRPPLEGKIHLQLVSTF